MPPFKGGSDYLTFKRVLARKYRLPEGTPPVVVDLIDKVRCVVFVPASLGHGRYSCLAPVLLPCTRPPALHLCSCLAPVLLPCTRPPALHPSSCVAPVLLPCIF